MSKMEKDSGKHSSKKGSVSKTKTTKKQPLNKLKNDKEKNANKKKNNKKNNSKANKVIKVILIVLITILITFVALFGTYIIKSGGNLSTAIKTMLKDVVGDQDPIFVLVMGISEDISAQLTDTIMLLGYNPDTNQAFVLSIPRDTFIGTNESKAGGFDKINALYQKNPQKTIDAVEKLTGINIDYYVTVKTSVLVKIVDTIGGVEYDVPINMDYDDPTQDLHIHLKKGTQVLNGKQAEHLVRFRHNNNGSTYSASYGDNDEGRTRTQREFMKVLAQKILSTRDVEKIKTIAKSVFDNLDTNIKLDQVFGYIPYAIDFNMAELQMEQLPGTTGILNNLWFFKADTKKTEALINGYIEKLGLTEAERKKYLKNTTTNKVTTNTTQKTTTTETKSNKNTTKKNNNTTEKSKTTNKTTKTTNKVTTTTTNKTTNTTKNESDSAVNKPATSTETSSENKTNEEDAVKTDTNKSEPDTKIETEKKEETESVNGDVLF